MTVLERLASLGITGGRATALAATLDATQVSRVSDRQLWVMISGRESGSASGEHVFPDGHLYPN